MSKPTNGKGSRRRPTNEDAYRAGWETIFARRPHILGDCEHTRRPAGDVVDETYRCPVCGKECRIAYDDI